MTTSLDERVWPVVLVGGRSRRFGRDKLVEPLSPRSSKLLVDVAINALRTVFGPIVAVVGECDARVTSRADGVIADRYPGVGPIGGVLSALEARSQSVFVLSGDLCCIESGVVECVLEVALANPSAGAVLACTDRLQWCVGVYRPRLTGKFSSAVASGEYALRRTVPESEVVEVPFQLSALRDADCPEDLLSEK